MIKIKTPTRIVTLDIGDTPELEQERIAIAETHYHVNLVMHEDGMYRCRADYVSWWIAHSDSHSTEHLPRLRCWCDDPETLEVVCGRTILGRGKTARAAVENAIETGPVLMVPGVAEILPYLFSHPECGCQYEAMQDSEWGLLTRNHWDECIHRIIARHCSSCSTDWTSATLEASGGDEGGLEREDCPNCKAEVAP